MVQAEWERSGAFRPKPASLVLQQCISFLPFQDTLDGGGFCALHSWKSPWRGLIVMRESIFPVISNPFWRPKLRTFWTGYRGQNLLHVLLAVSPISCLGLWYPKLKSFLCGRELILIGGRSIGPTPLLFPPLFLLIYPEHSIICLLKSNQYEQPSLGHFSFFKYKTNIFGMRMVFTNYIHTPFCLLVSAFFCLTVVSALISALIVKGMIHIEKYITL